MFLERFDLVGDLGVLFGLGLTRCGVCCSGSTGRRSLYRGGRWSLNRSRLWHLDRGRSWRLCSGRSLRGTRLCYRNRSGDRRMIGGWSMRHWGGRMNFRGVGSGLLWLEDRIDPTEIK